MSHVTGLVLSVSVCEERDEDRTPDCVAALNGWLSGRNYLPLVQVDQHMPRGKHPQILVYGGGYNHFEEDAFALVFLAQPWEMPENAVLLLNPEDGPTRVFRPETP